VVGCTCLIKPAGIHAFPARGFYDMFQFLLFHFYGPVEEQLSQDVMDQSSPNLRRDVAMETN